MPPQEDLAGRFELFLRTEKGFPAGSILHESNVGDYGRADVLLIDPNTEDVLGVVEIKGDDEHFDAIASQIDRLLVALRDPAVESFVLVLQEDTDREAPFAIWRRGDSGVFTQVLLDRFPDFHGLSAKKVAIGLAKLQRKRADTTDAFKTVCFSLAGAVAAIATTDVVLAALGSGFELLTTPRLALVGAALALALAPYVQRFKGLGIEFERFVRQQQKRRDE